MLRWPTGQNVIQCLGDKVTIFLGYTDAGSGFVYGYLVTDQNASGIPLGTIFAFDVTALFDLGLLTLIDHGVRCADPVRHLLF